MTESGSVDSGLPKVGEIFDSKYEIVELLGAGGMGEVFKARHVHLGSLRAIKVMRKNLVADESSRRRFSREARLATRVHHRNVAIVYDFTLAENGSYYIVSELVEGVTLRQWSASPELFSEAAALDIAIQTLRGLEHLHRGGIMHRDVSSDNIMITKDRDGNPLAKIIDLGLAKLLTDTPHGDQTTRTGLFLGNPRYSSPEQLGLLPDGEEIDARSDVYSFGVVLYELLTGAPPFASSTPQGYAAKHLMERPPALTPRPGNRPISEELQAVVWKALEKNRENRYRSAGELANALGKLAAEAPRGALASPPAGPAPSRGAAPVPEPMPVQIAVREPTPPPETAARDAAGPAGEDASAPIAAAPPTTLNRVLAVPPRRELWPLRYVLAGLAIAAVLVAIVAFWRSDSAPDPTPVVVTTTTAPLKTIPAPTPTAPLVLTGSLVIDAVPWGRIVSVNDGAKEWISGPALYTPRTLKLPPGNYTVALLGPDGTQQSTVVGLTSTEPAYVKIDFHPSEAGRAANSRP